MHGFEKFDQRNYIFDPVHCIATLAEQTISSWSEASDEIFLHTFYYPTSCRNIRPGFPI